MSSFLLRDDEFFEEREGKNLGSFRNYSKTVHPWQQQKEYQRAVVAAKMDRMFAKPFLCSLEGHREPVSHMTRCNRNPYTVVSCSSDGEMRFWDLAQRHCTKSIFSHERSAIRDLSMSYDDQWLASCGNDRKINVWPLVNMFQPLDIVEEDLLDTGNYVASEVAEYEDASGSASGSLAASDSVSSRKVKAALTFSSKHSQTTTCDFHGSKMRLASAGEVVQIWDVNRSKPISSLDGIRSTAVSLRWNPSERHLLCVTAMDMSVTLYDTREGSSVGQFRMPNRCNKVSWNPMDPNRFALACEDFNGYLFDMRTLKPAEATVVADAPTPVKVYEGNQSAVLSIDFAPSGLEVVTGGFDKVIRIYPTHSKRPREILHTKRMYQVHSALFSGDSRFVISGSNDGCVRLWKSQASEKLGPVSDEERKVLAYRNKLKAKFTQFDEVRRIVQNRRLPNKIKGQAKQEREMKTAEDRREANRMAHAKKDRSPADIQEGSIATD